MNFDINISDLRKVAKSKGAGCTNFLALDNNLVSHVTHLVLDFIYYNNN